MIIFGENLRKFEGYIGKKYDVDENFFFSPNWKIYNEFHMLDMLNNIHFFNSQVEWKGSPFHQKKKTTSNYL